jgi:hypothetical protein
MDVARRDIVKSVLGLVAKSTSQGTDADLESYEDADPDDYSAYPTAEALHFIIYGERLTV